MLDIGCWMLDAGCWMLNVRCLKIAGCRLHVACLFLHARRGERWCHCVLARVDCSVFSWLICYTHRQGRCIRRDPLCMDRHRHRDHPLPGPWSTCHPIRPAVGKFVGELTDPSDSSPKRSPCCRNKCHREFGRSATGEPGVVRVTIGMKGMRWRWRRRWRRSDVYCV